MTSRTTRRTFLKHAGSISALALAGCATTNGYTRRYDVFPSYVDDKTGAKVYNLTPAASQDVLIYQTHPMWTPRMAYFVYMTGGRIHAIDMATGKSRPLADTTTDCSMQWRSNDLYYFSGNDLFRLDVPSAYQGTGKAEKIATFPAEYAGRCGVLSVDAAGDVVYTGAVIEADKRYGIVGYSRDGWKLLTSVDFRIGHIQANPFISKSVMFCWETGGDAPQRTWFIDASTDKARPAYPEQNEEWVTHEAWWGPDRMIFTIWPYDDAHKQLPHGVAWSTVGSGQRNIIAQYPAWHAHGSPDGRWALGDDFDRNIWLIDMKTLERRLLTQGHLGPNCKTHPHSSFTPDSRAIVLNSSHSGNDDILLVPIPKWESLPKA